MNINKKRKTIAILRILQQVDKPIGSASISEKLKNSGVDLCERMVRYYLTQTDQEYLTENLGRRGHVITDQGRKELEVAIAIDKVGFINTRIDELAYRMNFDERNMKGNLILNFSEIDKAHYDLAMEKVALVMKANLGMGRFLLIKREAAAPDDSPESRPNNNLTIGTICSVTINGILLRHSVNMTSCFGGLLEIHKGVPVRFRQIIHYNGTTIDPLEIFIKSKMTSVNQVARYGTGCIGASFREIPLAAWPAVKTIINNLEQIGLGGILMTGKPNQPLLDIPVSTGRLGIIVAGGLNPIAALEECGVTTISRSLHDLCDFDKLQSIDSIPHGQENSRQGQM